MILDGGPTAVGIESTVVSLVRKVPTVLRPGMITMAELERATGVEWASGGAAENTERIARVTCPPLFTSHSVFCCREWLSR